MLNCLNTTVQQVYCTPRLLPHRELAPYPPHTVLQLV